jgi:hypothetical protein
MAQEIKGRSRKFIFVPHVSHGQQESKIFICYVTHGTKLKNSLSFFIFYFTMPKNNIRQKYIAKKTAVAKVTRPTRNPLKTTGALPRDEKLVLANMMYAMLMTQDTEDLDAAINSQRICERFEELYGFEADDIDQGALFNSIEEEFPELSNKEVNRLVQRRWDFMPYIVKYNSVDKKLVSESEDELQ